VRKAKSYLEFMSFSRQGLIHQLEFEGFSNEDAVYGADHCDADWMEQAVKKAESYLEIMAYSRQGLIDQLLFEGFTPEEAAHGVDATGLQ
jgi:acyl-coenzyme A synthetase/AMP-(fatty) acid ligase